MRRLTSGPNPASRVAPYMPRRSRRLDPHPVAHAVEAGQVARRLGGGDDVVRGDGVGKMGQLDLHELGAGAPRDELVPRGSGRGHPASTPRSRKPQGTPIAKPFDAGGEGGPQERERARASARRIGGVVTEKDFGDQSAVFDGSRERPHLVEGGGVGDEAVSTDAPPRGLQPDDAAEGRRLTNGASRVRSQGNGSHGCCNSHSRAARRAARHACWIPWVASGEVGAVLVG